MKINEACHAFSLRRLSGVSTIKTLLIMKLTAILLLCSALQVTARGHAQTITCNARSITLQKLFTLIEKQTGNVFFYDKKDVGDIDPIDVNFKSAPLIPTLKGIFANLPLDFELQGNTIFIIRKPQMATPPAIIPAATVQPQDYKGRITNENGEPLAGVSVSVKGTGAGAASNEDGFFIVSANAGEVLEFSMVGFKPLTVKLTSDRSVLSIVLVQATADLSNIVVTVGYGTQRKTNVTGAIEVVDKKRIASRPQGNVGQLLQGVSPGLNVMTNNSGGEPDATMNFNIRGMGTPFVLVDGMPMNINQVNPADIESVTVLKDASSAAIYGANAPYGVILITTKRGKNSDGKPNLSYNADFGLTSPTVLPNPANSLDFANSWNDATANSGISPFFSAAVIGRITQYLQDPNSIPATGPDPFDPTKWAKHEYANGNTNWYDALIKKNALRQKHNITMNGGTDAMSYYVSAGFYDQKGQMRYMNDQFQRYNLDAKINTKVTKWMQMNFLTKYARATSDYPNEGYGGLEKNVMWYDLPRRYPTDPVQYPNGEFSEMSRINIYQNGGRDITTSNELWLRMETILEPVKNWLIKGDYSWKNANTNLSRHHALVYAHGPQGDPYITFDSRTPNDFSQMSDADNYWTFNISSSYEKKLGDHNFKLLVGYQRELQRFNSLFGLRNKLITDFVPSLATATGDMTVNDNIYHWATTGLFFRLNYDFRNKYLLEINGRRNGTSKFQEGSRYGTFPSVSGGYKISEEKFWTPIAPYVNYLKVRASYGSLGNHNVANYLYLPIMPINSQVSWIMGETRPIGVQPPGIVSNSLTWETVKTVDIGLEAAFLNRRLDLTADYFRRSVLNMLGTSSPLPGVLGTSVPLENNAEKQNNGWELGIGWNDKIGQDFTYNIRATLSDYTVKITKWNNPDKNLSSNYAGMKEGDIWGLESDGLFQDANEINGHASQSLFYANWYPGDVRYNDLNGDGVVNVGNNTLADHGDLKVIGNALPRYSYSLYGGVTWKNLDFSMFWMGVAKQDVWLNNNLFWGIDGSIWHASTFAEHLDYWRPNNTGAYYPRPYFSDEVNKNRQPSTKYLQSAAYLRLKSLQIGYTLPSSLVRQGVFKSARVYFNGENLLTASKIKGMFDPEGIVGLYGQGKIYPLSRIISFGLNVNF